VTAAGDGDHRALSRTQYSAEGAGGPAYQPFAGAGLVPAALVTKPVEPWVADGLEDGRCDCGGRSGARVEIVEMGAATLARSFPQHAPSVRAGRGDVSTALVLNPRLVAPRA
jgi:hypothetical protein